MDEVRKCPKCNGDMKKGSAWFHSVKSLWPRKTSARSVEYAVSH